MSPVSFLLCHAPATTDSYTLSLHDALPIYVPPRGCHGTDRAVLIEDATSLNTTTGLRELVMRREAPAHPVYVARSLTAVTRRSEEHTSELQSHSDLVCRLLLEKKIRGDVKY